MADLFARCSKLYTHIQPLICNIWQFSKMFIKRGCNGLTSVFLPRVLYVYIIWVHTSISVCYICYNSKTTLCSNKNNVFVASPSAVALEYYQPRCLFCLSYLFSSTFLVVCYAKATKRVCTLSWKHLTQWRQAVSRKKQQEREIKCQPRCSRDWL